jgi:hypothetical protein
MRESFPHGKAILAIDDESDVLQVVPKRAGSTNPLKRKPTLSGKPAAA